MKQKTLLYQLMLLVCLLVGGSTSAWADDPTYKLTQVTSVSAGNKYVFVSNSYALSNSVSNSALQTSSYSSTGLSGTEAYVWTLESATGGFYLKNVSLKSNQYLNNASKTAVSFGSSSSIWSIGFTNGVALISNTSNSDRFLGDAGGTGNSRNNTYKAYATTNLNNNSHDFAVYILEEETEVTSLAVKTAPTKVRYEVGETLDMTGFVLDVNNGTDVSSGYTMTMGGSAITNGATLSSVGKKTLVVSYGGLTVNQAISVGSVTGISVTTAPTKTSYNTGDSFDPTGMVVTASLSTGEAENPDTWTKEITGYTVDPENNLAPANTYVTITYATKTATQNITVTNVAVTGVSVKASTTIEKGKTETLTPTFTPTNATNKNVSWESDNTSVATVTAAGVVTGVAAGTANITVTTEDGDYEATCVVTVVNEKGSIDAPYSVADVEATSGSLTNKYVTGYVVGYAENSKHFPYGNNAANSNLTLADTPNVSISVNGTATSSNTDGLIAIKLTNQFQTNYGLGYNNGALIGEKIIVKGEVNDYFTGRGVKTTNVLITDKSYTTNEAISSTSSIPNYADNTNTIYYVASGSTISGAANVVKETTAGACTADEIKITDGVALNIPTDVTATKVTNSRTIAADEDAYTWYEPYAYTLPAGNTAYTFTGASGTALTFTELGSQILAANTPYLIVAADAVNGSINSSTVVKATPTTNTSGGTQGNWQFVGTYKSMTATEAEAANMWALGVGNKWFYYTGSDTYGVYPRRAYMINSQDKGGAKQFDSNFGDAENEVTHIELVNSKNPKESRIYTLDGKYVGTKKELLNGGIYVKDGKKFIIK